jgi:curved DNA binding protein
VIQDYSLANPDTLTKLKTAAEISQKVLVKVKEACVAGANLLEICQKGDALLEEETGKVYKGKKIAKGCVKGDIKKLISGIAFPTAISPNNTVAHLSPIASEPEAEITLKAGDMVKISLGAHIDGFAGVLADTIVIPEEGAGDVVTGRKADVLMAAWLASEAAIRLVKPGNKNYAVTDAVAKIADAFGCKPLEGIFV